ncbi:hypothetical protein BS47DRAFT_1379762 [Hydnum rufescens UP504]|uniref:Double-strand-break repair protein rad21 n=1 Tax=Hydnum rufescens UP504 TaxID=1448309 RepID=A0A9P6B6J8_9AGAM|nr:hypothetical protein BS47DRAFT_1379762 [Hydnum rufescens UP504]
MSLFYSEAILSRRGPLARIWLAAHYERKLSKSLTLQTDIGQSVGAIVGPEVVPMALRLSGQLLLGVAFRPGVVDLTEDQLQVSRNAITISAEGFDAEFLIPEQGWDLPALGNQHIARQKDITLSTAHDIPYGFNDDDFGFGIDGIGSQDWGDFDTGLSFGDDNLQPQERDDHTNEMSHRNEMRPLVSRGVGVPNPMALHAYMPGIDKDEPSHLDFGTGFDGGDFDLGDVDLELNFGDEIELPVPRDVTPNQQPPPPQPHSRATTPFTPRTAGRLAELANQHESTSKKKKTNKRQIVDTVTELKDGPGTRGRRGLGELQNQDVSEITTELRFLPRSRAVMRLLEIRANPLAYFMPTMVTPNGHFFSAAPPGIAPELAELFMIPVIDHRRSRANDVVDPNPRSPKKAQSEANFGIGSDVVGGVDHTGDFDGPSFALQDVHMESYDQRPPSVRGEVDNAGDFDMDAPAFPVEDLGLDTYDSQSCSIGIFDLRSKKDSDSQTQTQTQEAEDIERSTEQVQSKGYSQNTIKAIGVIRGGLEKEKADDKYLSFVRVSEKASRRAASAFFFELLVLGTRDCIKLTQSAEFENIEIRGKDKLWESFGAQMVA